MSDEHTPDPSGNVPDDERAPQVEAEHAELVAAAAQLPPLRPSRDLWDGIAARISTPTVDIGAAPVDEADIAHAATRRSAALRRGSSARLATAAALLIAVTAGVTWQLAQRDLAADRSPAAASTVTVTLAADDEGAASALPTLRVSGAYDQEIAELRAILAQRDIALDEATVRVVDENLRVIDEAIAGARAALEQDPASALLAQRLAGVYDMKLDLLRRLAALTEIS